MPLTALFFVALAWVESPPPPRDEPRMPEGVTCTIRVLFADPEVDPGIVRSAPPDVDPKMVVPARCADDPAQRPPRR